MLVPFLVVVLIFVLTLVYRRINPDTSTTNPLWKKIETIFIENGGPGTWSSNRVAFIFTMVLSNIIMWGAILYLVIVNSAFPDIPNSIVMLYGLANGIASVSKVFQKREERFMEQFSNAKNDNKDN